MSLSGIRGLVYTLFATIVLSTLWVTSLSVLSARENATALIADAGADILNPFLVARGTGISQDYYATLEASAKAHPSQALSIQFIKVGVLGKEIVGKSYADGTHVIYGAVASAYYTGGATAVFSLPPELQQVLSSFALFNPSNIQVIPGGPTVSQLPSFVQPFFVVIGLTPVTFTQGGHQSLLNLLPWFWLATGVLGLLAVVLNPSGKKLAGLAHGIIHTSWPIVAILVGLSIAAAYYAGLAAYRGVLGVVRGAFLPVYGGALVVGLLVLALTTWLPRLLQQRQQAPAPAQVPLGVGAIQPTAPIRPRPPMPPPPAPTEPGAPVEPPPSGGTQG
jgi:hypothetical protein